MEVKFMDSGWKHGLREDILTLIDALKDVVDVLSKSGYMHIPS